MPTFEVTMCGVLRSKRVHPYLAQGRKSLPLDDLCNALHLGESERKREGERIWEKGYEI